MKAAVRDDVRWLISGATAALVVVAGVMLFRQTTLSVTPLALRAPKPEIVIGRGRSDELAMRDLTPLFLPTTFNASPRSVTVTEPGRAFFDHDPGQHTLFAEDNPHLEVPAVVVPPVSAAAAVAMPPPPLSAGIGRKNGTVPPLADTGGRVDVYSSGSGASVLGLTLPDEARPSLDGPAALWQPLEFAAAIDAAGLVDSLVLTRSSGREEVDAHFRNYLASRFHLGDRLPPGFYRVVVAP